MSFESMLRTTRKRSRTSNALASTTFHTYNNGVGITDRSHGLATTISDDMIDKLFYLKQNRGRIENPEDER